MGYRSSVAYVINFSSSKKRNEYINILIATGNEDLIRALKECEVYIPTKGNEDDWQSGRINFYTSDVKWYESFPEVQAHIRLYKWAEELYPDDCGWHFIRVGEEQGDIVDYMDDKREWTPDDVYPVTDIETPFDIDYDSFDLDTFLTTTKEEA